MVKSKRYKCKKNRRSTSRKLAGCFDMCDDKKREIRELTALIKSSTTSPSQRIDAKQRLAEITCQGKKLSEWTGSQYRDDDVTADYNGGVLAMHIDRLKVGKRSKRSKRRRAKQSRRIK